MEEVEVTLVCPAAPLDAQLRKVAHDRPPAGTPVKPEHLTLDSGGAQPPDAAQAPADTMAVKDEELLLDLTLDSDSEEPAQGPDWQAELRPPARRSALARLQSGTLGAQPSRETTAGMDMELKQEQQLGQQQQQAQRSLGVPTHLERVPWEPLQARPAAEAGARRAAAEQDSEQEPRSFQGGSGDLRIASCCAMQPQGRQEDACSPGTCLLAADHRALLSAAGAG